MILESGLIGGLMRLVPELIGLWNKKTDYKHELLMMDKQLELARFKGQDERETRALEGDINKELATIEAHAQALQSQMQRTGIRIVDMLNFLVRPVTTYYFLAFYGIVKLAMVVIACRSVDPWVAILQCWTETDAAILWGILGFWFVGRVFDRQK